MELGAEPPSTNLCGVPLYLTFNEVFWLISLYNYVFSRMRTPVLVIHKLVLHACHLFHMDDRTIVLFVAFSPNSHLRTLISVNRENRKCAKIKNDLN